MDKKPKIRFKGFDDAWEQRKLGDHFEERNERSAFGEMISVTINSGVVKATELGRHDNSSEDKSKYKRVEIGDIAYNSMRMWQGANGYSKYSGILSPAYTVCKPCENTDSLFFSYLFKKPKMIHKFEINSQGLTKDTWNLKFPPFSEIEILAPKLEEQAKIGAFFSKLDNLITLHQRKYEKLKNVKKSMLEKMFPKNNSKFPEIRFAGFTDAWEQCNVSELLEERNTQTPENVEYPLMAFVAYDGIVKKGDRYDRAALVKDEENKKYKQTELGDFIYSSNNLTTGSIGLNRYGKACISPVYSIFYTTNQAHSDFIGYALTRKDFVNQMVRSRQGVVYGQWRIHESDFLKLNILAPKLEEQQKIGVFFSKLDNLITLHQRKFEKLKNIKKSMLEKMFPNNN